MKNIMTDNDRGLSDIVPIFVGYEQCEPSHSYGPHIRDHYIIHVCISGKGEIHDKLGEHRVSAGEFFIIRPGEVTTYRADEKDPWLYMWLAFRGTYADVFMSGKTVYKCPGDLIPRMYETLMAESSDAHAYTAYIYELIKCVCATDKPVKDSFSKIKRYIKYNYMEDVSVDNLSRMFGFERSYLYRMFMKKYGIGVKEYIIKTRMERARAFLSEGHSVASTAYMVGYKDEFNFSRAFKKHCGIAPSLFRSKMDSQESV